MTDSFLDDLGRQLHHADSTLRAASAVPRAPTVSGRGRRPTRWRRRAGLLVVAMCALAAVVSLIGRTDATDLSARAYAATTGPGIIHWRTEIAGSSGGKVGSRQRTEGWARNGVTHELRYDVVHGKAILQSDSRTADGQTTTWIRSESDYLRRPAQQATTANPFQSGDPFAIFRRAYRAGKLTKVGASRFGVDLPGRWDDTHRDAPLTYYDIDPDSALPIRFVVKTPAGQNPGNPPTRRAASRTVMTFSVYEQLPFNQTTRKLLRLRPHPSGGPEDVPAAEHFTVLRTGARPGPAAAQAIARMARMMVRGGRLAAAAARALGPEMYLLPGRAHVCLVQVSVGGGSGGTCTTTQEAIKRGLRIQQPGKAVFLVAPDGVNAVRARLRGGRSQRIAVHNNLARLPPAAYAWQFLE